MKERLAVNAASGVMLLVITIAAAFLLTPIIVSALGNRDYGVWEIIVVLVGYVSLFDFGLGPALVRFFAFEAARNEPGAIRGVFATASLSLSLLGVLALVLLWLLSFSPEAIANLESGEVPGLATVFRIVGATLLIKFPSTCLTAYLLATQRHYFFNSVRSVGAIVQALSTWYALTRLEGSGLIWLASIILVVTVGEFTFFATYLARTEPEIRPSPSAFSFDKLRELVRFGGKSLLGLLSLRLRTQAIPIVIAQVLGVERVVFFVLAQRLSEYALQLGTAVSRPLTPFWSDLYGRDNTSGIRTRWIVTSRLLQFLYCGMGVGVIFIGEPFVGRWMGPEYAAESRHVIWLTASALFFEGLAPNAFQVLVGMNKHGRAGLVLLSAAAIGIGLAIGLGFRFELTGVAAGYATGVALASLGVMTIACNAIEIPIGRHLRETLLPLIPPLSVEAGSLWMLFKVLGAPVDYTEILLYTAAAGLTYVVAWWGLTLNPTEREMLGSISRGIRRGVR